MEITQAYLKQVYSYNPETGLFIWKKARRSCDVGKIAGTKTGNGYIYLSIDSVRYLAHRMAWLYMTGSLPEDQIDHRNRDRSDNMFNNLRSCSKSQNLGNSPKPKNNTSGYKGVSWDRAVEKWRVSVCFQKKHHYIGRYTDKKIAAKAYNKKALELFGEFAGLNEI